MQKKKFTVRRKVQPEELCLSPDEILTGDGYSTAYDEPAYKLCLMGFELDELADFFNVSDDSVRNWERSYPAFAAAIQRGRIMADAKVAESLFKRATGYEHEKTRTVEKDGITTRESIVEYIPPDVKAALEWLKMRQKNKWDGKAAAQHNAHKTLPQPIIRIYQCGPPPASSEEEVYEREQIDRHV